MLSTEILCDILGFLARHEMDALQLVNVAFDALLAAHFDDHPLRRVDLTVRGHRSYVVEKPSGANKPREVVFAGEGLVDESAACLLRQCLLRAFVSNLTVLELVTHNTIDMLLPVKDHFRNAVCIMPLHCANDAVTERAYNELLACKKILIGHLSEPVRNWAVHTDFFRFRCWEVCNELHFVRRLSYSVDLLIEWLSTGTDREFTAGDEVEERILELVEKVHQHFLVATTSSSYRLNFTYYFWNSERLIKPSVRTNDTTHERVEVEVKQNASPAKVAVRRYRLQ